MDCDVLVRMLVLLRYWMLRSCELWLPGEPGRWSIECVASSEVTAGAGVSTELCSTAPELLLVMTVLV